MAKTPAKPDNKFKDERPIRRLIGRVAVECRIKGLAWDEICQIIEQKHNIKCNETKARNCCDETLARVPTTNANHLRALESHRFDVIVRDFIAVVMTKDAPFYDKAKAASVLLKVSAQRCQMLGLNMQPVFLTPTTQAAEQVANNLSHLVASINATPEVDPSPIGGSIGDEKSETWHDRESMLS